MHTRCNPLRLANPDTAQFGAGPRCDVAEWSAAGAGALPELLYKR